MDILSGTGAGAHAHQQGDLQPAHHGDVKRFPWLDSFVMWQLRTGTGNNKTFQTGTKMKQLLSCSIAAPHIISVWVRDTIDASIMEAGAITMHSVCSPKA